MKQIAGAGAVAGLHRLNIRSIVILEREGLFSQSPEGGEQPLHDSFCGHPKILRAKVLRKNERVAAPSTSGTGSYEKTRWIRAKTGQGGSFFPSAGLGDVVEPGQRLGRIVDPFTDASYDVVSTIPGEIVGMTLPKPVLSGYPLFHVAWHEAD
ncbi:MAG: hypothetical protein P8102_13165 [Gammaproteobacteria bacterium]